MCVMKPCDVFKSSAWDRAIGYVLHVNARVIYFIYLIKVRCMTKMIWTLMRVAA